MTYKYFCYMRKSQESDERQMLSLDSQRDKARECFPDLDLEFIAEARSAREPHRRPLFNAMVTRLQQGERQGIVSWHPDRLSRNPTDAGLLVQLIVDGVLKDLRFASYTFINSPEGIMMLQIALSQSQYYSAKLSQDVKRGMHRKAAMGWLCGVAPPGYRNTLDRTRGASIIIKDPERFDLVRHMWRLVLVGAQTPAAIRRLANAEWGYRSPVRRRVGGTPLSHTSFYTMVRNPFYCGRYEYPRGSGNWYEGAHEPMVTPQEFDQVQAILNSKNPKSFAETRTFAFTGLMRCACGHQITAEDKREVTCPDCRRRFSEKTRRQCPKCRRLIVDMHEPTRYYYLYYHCAARITGCRQPSVTGAHLEEQIIAFLRRVDVHADVLRAARAYLQQTHGTETTAAMVVKENRAATVGAIDAKLEKLLDLHLQDQVTDTEYQCKRSALQEERVRLSTPTPATGERRRALPVETLSFAADLCDRFRNSEALGKRTLLKILSSNMVLEDKKLRMTLQEPFRLLEDVPHGLRATSSPIEHETSEETTGSKRHFGVLSHAWRARLDRLREYYQTCDLSEVPHFPDMKPPQ